MLRSAIRGPVRRGLHPAQALGRCGLSTKAIASFMTTATGLVGPIGGANIFQRRYSHFLHIPSLLQHNCSLNVLEGEADSCSPTPDGTTVSPAYCAPKLIATIGPSCSSVEILKEMIRHGMSVARLNFSHGSYDVHLEHIRRIRQASAELCRPVAIALDTKGAEIRTGSFAPPASDGQNNSKQSSQSVGVQLDRGTKVIVTSDPQFAKACTKGLLYLDYAPLIQVARPGNRILVADGTVELTVESIHEAAEHRLHCVVTGAGYLSGRNNVHLPGIDVDLPAVSPRDREDILFGLRNGIDMIFASFVRSREHVEELRTLVQQHHKMIQEEKSNGASDATAESDVTPDACRLRTDVAIIAKIENHRGLHNIDSILDVADGIMVARGDLGVEIPVERVFLAQKMLIGKCNAAAKPVICATQMLESMKGSPRPTRAEATDVANAVIDGADGVMLSGETASGQFPLESLQTLRRVAHQGHLYIRHGKRFQELLSSDIGSSVYSNARSSSGKTALAIHDSVASSAVLTAFEIHATCIVTTTVSTRSVRLLSKYNPPCPIIAVCHSLPGYMKLQLMRGVIPVYLPSLKGRQTHRLSIDSKYVVTDHLSVEEWTDRFEEWVDIALDALKDGLLQVDGLAPSLAAAGEKVIVTCTDDRRGFRGVRGLCTIRQM